MMSEFNRSVSSQSMRFRWFTCNTTEIRLSNGKYVVFDPFLPEPSDRWGRMGMSCGYTVDDLEGCDYVIVTHAHGDHIEQMKELYDRFHPQILVHEATAIYYARHFKIPERDIFPFSNHETYDFGDFILETSEGRHNAGNLARPWVDVPVAATEEYLGVLGSLFNTNFVLTTHDGFRMGFSAGTWDAVERNRWTTVHPNVLFRHRTNWQMDPKEMAEIIESIGAQISFPWHHNNAYSPDYDYDFNEFTANVDNALKEMGSNCRFINPERGKWYQVVMSCCMCEDQ